jgi:hypothetical protein
VSSPQFAPIALHEDGIGDEADGIPPDPGILPGYVPEHDPGQHTGHDSGAEFPASFNNALLRAAIRNNSVTFPSQTVYCRNVVDGDMRWRIVQLYFVCGWPIRRICDRYRLTRQSIHNILTQWRHRAVAAGFVQEIEPSRGAPGAPILLE